MLPIIIFILALYAIPKAEIQVEVPKITAPPPDNRIQKLTTYLQKKNSPMATEAAGIIQASDESGIDYKLLTGIAKAESGFERAGNTKDNNAWGFGCSGQSPCEHFTSFSDGARTVAATLRHHRAYREFQTTGRLEDISKRYLSGNKERWEATIREVMEELK